MERPSPNARPPGPATTRMFREAAEGPTIARGQLARNATSIMRLATNLRERRPRAVITCARGSSDHAATYAKYLFETRVGILTASAAPSVASVYGSSQDLRDCLFIALSQSGRSPDLLESARAAASAGARVIALVNDEDSPLAGLAEAIPLCAGKEESVAATKSFLAMLVALAHLAAAWSDDQPFLDALHALPDTLDLAWRLDWSGALPVLEPAANLYVIARGVGLGVAQEAALKCKETCGLHAESFSSAEVRHGPQALLHEDFPALLFAQDDETRPGVEDLGRDLVSRRVKVLGAGLALPGAVTLPTVEAHPALAPIALAQSFYRMANALAVARGFDPDNPPYLRKVTETR
ncbi:MAG TPA: SIS domain-containing protein [Usitatibacter sp.]|nr:SIS domain-containing protein [Usitatibacter sp.]